MENSASEGNNVSPKEGPRGRHGPRRAFLLEEEEPVGEGDAELEADHEDEEEADEHHRRTEEGEALPPAEGHRWWAGPSELGSKLVKKNTRTKLLP